MAKIVNGIADLINRRTLELRDMRRCIYHAEPPAGLSRDLLIRAAAYQIQEQELGGLGRVVKRKLRALEQKMDSKKSGPFELDPSLKPGARLIREWPDRTYSVIALEDGFDFEGRRYSSLSKIAREITGTRWSGPRFFGLTEREKASAIGAEETIRREQKIQAEGALCRLHAQIIRGRAGAGL